MSVFEKLEDSTSFKNIIEENFKELREEKFIFQEAALQLY